MTDDSKTPEELAAEWYWKNLTDQPSEVLLTNPPKYPADPRKAFLAGYEAGFDAAITTQSKTGNAIDRMIQLARKGFVGEGLEMYKASLAGYKAAQEQSDSCEHILDMSKMVDVNSCSCKGILNNWISVKDRLPKEDVAVLVYGQVLNDPPDVIGVRRRYNGDQDWKHTWESEDGFIYREDDVTHWMPLPEPPKDAKE